MHTDLTHNDDFRSLLHEMWYEVETASDGQVLLAALWSTSRTADEFESFLIDHADIRNTTAELVSDACAVCNFEDAWNILSRNER